MDSIVCIDKDCAAVDANFVIRAGEIENNAAKILEEIFKVMKIRAIIHPLVYQYEIISQNDTIKDFFKSGLILKPTTEEIFQDDSAKREYYKFVFMELYKFLNGKEFPAENSLFTYWKSQENLGELHSVSMCLICGCGIFFSDDGDAKILQTIVESRLLGSIRIYNREETIDAYERSGGKNLLRKDRRAFQHQ